MGWEWGLRCVRHETHFLFLPLPLHGGAFSHSLSPGFLFFVHTAMSVSTFPVWACRNERKPGPSTPAFPFSETKPTIGMVGTCQCCFWNPSWLPDLALSKLSLADENLGSSWPSYFPSGWREYGSYRAHWACAICKAPWLMMHFLK